MIPLNEDMTEDDVKLFLDEADELLSKFEESLIALEGGSDSELIQEIFRVAHTLKGSSATIGHGAMAAVTHEMETVLDAVRKGLLEPNTQVIDVMFQSLDILKTLKELITPEGYEEIEVGHAVEQLRGLLSAPQPAADESAVETIEAKTDLTQTLGAFTVSVRFSDQCLMAAARAFQVMDRLLDLGRVLDVRPSIEDLEKDMNLKEFSVILDTSVGADEIERAVNSVFDVASCRVIGDTPDDSEAEDDEDDGEPGKDELSPASGTDVAAPGGKGFGNGGRSKASKGSDSKKAAKMSATVRVDVDRLDTLMNLVAELIIDRSRLERLDQELKAVAGADDLASGLETIISHLSRTTTDLQEEIMKARMIPVESVFKRFPRMMRDLSQKVQKEVKFLVEGQETELDRSVVEEIGDPLIHILRNAISHGIESPEDRRKAGKPEVGTVILKAYHEEGHIVMTIEDDGRGIDPKLIAASAAKKGLIDETASQRLTEAEAVELLFKPGFSTAKEVDDVSGRGVGLDIVRSNIERLNGTVEVSSVIGQQTVFTIRLPLTLAIIKALLVKITGQTYAIPLSSVKETFKVSESDIKMVSGAETILYRNQVLPLVRLDRILTGSIEDSKFIFVVIVDAGGKTVSLGVDSFIREQEIVVKSLGRFLGELDGLSGMTILGDGRLAPILDVPGLLRKAVGH